MKLILLALAVVAALVWLLDIRLGDDVIVYQADCDEAVTSWRQCRYLFHAWTPPTVFIATRANQIVITQRDGAAPEKLDRCAVKDDRNWSCMTDWGLGLRLKWHDTMIDGNYRHQIYDPDDASRFASDAATMVQVPKWKWLLLRATLTERDTIEGFHKQFPER
jgi:hypothetical protein